MKWLKSTVVSAVVLFVIGGHVRADSYNVNAVVPYEVSSIPAVIRSPVDNYATSSASINVSGTCEYIAPGTIVVMTRNASIVGSGACSVGGTFSLLVSLISGPNQLLARTANLNSLYGPDSVPVTVQYNIPPGPPLPAASPSSSSSQPQPNDVTPQLAAPSDLAILSDVPIHIIDDTQKTVSITVQLSGGETPYDLVINWGDGTVETRRIEASGSYTFTYEYSRPGTYRIAASVTDVRGVSRQYSFTVMGTVGDKNTEPDGVGMIQNTAHKDSGGLWWYWLWWIIPLLFLCFALGMYVESRWIAGAKRRKSKKKK